jgi:cobalt/nickel transport system permease protein
MHLADGVLSTSVVAATSAVAAAGVAIGLKGIEDEDIPKISLMSATFFGVSLISIPVPPTSVHPLLCGLIGILLGRKLALAFVPALLLQALLFRHGGLTTVGANTLLLAIPGYLSYLLFRNLPIKSIALRGGVVGGLSVVMTVVVLIVLLAMTDPRFAQGDFSVARIVAVGHLPLVAIEGVLTGFAVKFMEKYKPDWITGKGSMS